MADFRVGGSGTGTSFGLFGESPVDDLGTGQIPPGFGRNLVQFVERKAGVKLTEILAGVLSGVKVNAPGGLAAGNIFIGEAGEGEEAAIAEMTARNNALAADRAKNAQALNQRMDTTDP